MFRPLICTSPTNQYKGCRYKKKRCRVTKCSLDFRELYSNKQYSKYRYKQQGDVCAEAGCHIGRYASQNIGHENSFEGLLRIQKVPEAGARQRFS